MADKTQYKDKLKEITDSIEKGIGELYESEKYKKYLKTMSRFHKYSVNNTMLIYMQNPNATYVAGYEKWRSDFKRYVKSGQKGIKIIAPSSYIKRVTTEVRDPKTNKAKTDSLGFPLTETREIKVPTFRATTVFDISQTDGEPLPTLVAKLDANVKNYDSMLEAVKKASTAEIKFEELSDQTDGFFDHEAGTITIRAGMSEAQTVCACIHEMAHSRLHERYTDGLDTNNVFLEGEICGVSALYSGGRINDELVPKGMYKYELRGSPDKAGIPIAVETSVGVNHVGSVITSKPLPISGDEIIELGVKENLVLTGRESNIRDFWIENRKDRRTEEIEAESISYAVCAYYGIDTKENSFPYIAAWSEDKNLTELKNSLVTINKTSSDIITDIDASLLEITKRREAELEAAKNAEKEALREAALNPSGRERISVLDKLHEYREADKKSGIGRSKSKEKIIGELGEKDKNIDDGELEF